MTKTKEPFTNINHGSVGIDGELIDLIGRGNEGALEYLRYEIKRCGWTEEEYYLMRDFYVLFSLAEHFINHEPKRVAQLKLLRDKIVPLLDELLE